MRKRVANSSCVSPSARRIIFARGMRCMRLKSSGVSGFASGSASAAASPPPPSSSARLKGLARFLGSRRLAHMHTIGTSVIVSYTLMQNIPLHARDQTASGHPLTCESTSWIGSTAQQTRFIYATFDGSLERNGKKWQLQCPKAWKSHNNRAGSMGNDCALRAPFRRGWG